MKKIIFLTITFITILFSFSLNVDALCYDDELNNWAVSAEIKFIDFDSDLINEETNRPLSDTMDYSYILTVNPMRNDIVMKATNNYKQNLVWEYIPGHKVWGITNYTAKGQVDYEITFTGGENSACPGEVLKTIKYTLEPLNLYYKMEKCQNYPDGPLCGIFQDTSNITKEEFDKQMDEYIEEQQPEPEPTIFKKIINFFFDYVIYVLVPFIAIAIFYKTKIHKVKKEERRK